MVGGGDVVVLAHTNFSNNEVEEEENVYLII